jgi:hypothetical protein
VLRILLLGAGFSRNWGAPLSQEINGSLLGELHDDEFLARQLRDHPFEELFSGFDPARGSEDEVRRQTRFQNAVKSTFKRVNDAFHDLEFREAPNETAFRVRDFLQQFNLIFTLNQDLLIERTYMRAGCARTPVRPGLVEVRPDVWRPKGPYETLPVGAAQPYIKLHGSTDWESEDGSDLLIMGNAKSGAIAKVSVLRWYHQEFERCLKLGAAKLMVIGYSFQDQHINEVICSGAKEHGLMTFIIDPRGRRVLDDPKWRPGQIRAPRGVEEIRIVGELRRSLREILGGGDRFAVGEINRFLAR